MDPDVPKNERTRMESEMQDSSGRSRRSLSVTAAAAMLLALASCGDVKIQPPSFPECPPSCHGGAK